MPKLTINDEQFEYVEYKKAGDVIKFVNKRFPNICFHDGKELRVNGTPLPPGGFVIDYHGLRIATAEGIDKWL